MPDYVERENHDGDIRADIDNARGIQKSGEIDAMSRSLPHPDLAPRGTLKYLDEGDRGVE